MVSRGFEDLLGSMMSVQRYSEAGDEAPHKPLVMLDALANLRKGVRRIVFSECEARLAPLIRTYWYADRPARVEQPFWRLKTEWFWHLDFPAQDALTDSGAISAMKLREMNASAGFSEAAQIMLLENVDRITWAVRVLLPEVRLSDTQQGVITALDLPLQG